MPKENKLSELQSKVGSIINYNGAIKQCERKLYGVVENTNGSISVLIGYDNSLNFYKGQDK